MIWLRRTLALALAASFVAAFPAALFALVVTTIVLDASYLKDALSRSNAYDLSADKLIPAFVRRELSSGPVTQIFGDEQFVAGVRRAVSPAWLQQTTENALDQLVPYVTGRSPTLSLHFDLEQPKFALIQELTSREPMSSRAVGDFERDVLVLIPDGATVTSLTVPELARVREVVLALKTSAFIGAGILALLLAILGALGGRGLRGKFQWAAATLAAGSLVAWMLAFGAEAGLPALLAGPGLRDEPADELLAIAIQDLAGPLALELIRPVTQAARALSIAATVVFALTLLRRPVTGAP